MTTAVRGQVFRVDLGHGLKPWVVLSNNQRNRNLDSVIAARITTTGKNAHLPTIVPLTQDDPLVGFVLCDDLVQLFQEELTRPIGALSPATMRQIFTALRLALP
jgi:mRNA interferase MazF